MHRYWGSDFILLGVNSDSDVERLREFVVEEGITWPNVVDRGTDGPVSRAWGVVSWPTNFVIDRSGRIRYRDLYGAALDRAIKSLIDER